MSSSLSGRHIRSAVIGCSRRSGCSSLFCLYRLRKGTGSKIRINIFNRLFPIRMLTNLEVIKSAKIFRDHLGFKDLGHSKIKRISSLHIARSAISSNLKQIRSKRTIILKLICNFSCKTSRTFPNNRNRCAPSTSRSIFIRNKTLKIKLLSSLQRGI